ncbi:TIGR02453 family protein [Salipiger sp. P9]|uniref:TIGR02453 family protein n=1 Tax=Salipiger pentaromativorans TaxID=2943193 RepID=UPI002157E92A|nr:TIGR02453 family protein [Salipiger pentaromativorans]MCR8546852.1 TIGR02453 family protein [Salipiger pentaromativorans]
MPAQIELADFAPRARNFLKDLAENNDRGWFRAQKTRYDTEVRRPAERLLDLVARSLETATGERVRSKLFRPHRDVRFSDDKTPYHTHLHAAWSVPDGRGWYFGLSPDYATAGGGVMRFDAPQTERWRSALDGPPGPALDGLLSELGARLDPPDLDTVPAPYRGDHPRAELLRRTGCVVWLDELFDALSADAEAGLTGAFARLQPLQDWLADNL